MLAAALLKLSQSWPSFGRINNIGGPSQRISGYCCSACIIVVAARM